MPLFHVSEDPDIEVFVPRLAEVVQFDEELVWALDGQHIPAYWFPRDCPRATVWARDDEEFAILSQTFGTEADRLHVIESGWRERLDRSSVFVYSFDESGFEPFAEIDGCWVARTAVTPTGIRPLGDLVALHRAAGIELRMVDNLWPTIDDITSCGLPFSIIRARHGAPRH